MICHNRGMIEKAYGFVLREGEEGRELLVFEHAGMPEGGLQVPGGTDRREGDAQPGGRPRSARAERPLPRRLAAGDRLRDRRAQRWHCYATEPGFPLPDSWRCEPIGPEAVKGLRFEYRWVALAGEEALAGAQEEARQAVVAFGLVG